MSGQLRCGERQVHALRRVRRRRAPEGRALQRARPRARQAARSVLRRWRQLRHAQPAIRRVRPGAMGRRQAETPGEIHRDTLGSVPHRLPGPRPGHHGRGGVRQECPHPRHARRQHQQRRRARRVAVAAVEGLGPHHRQLRRPCGDAALSRGVHHDNADQRLPLIGPAGGHLRDRAADGQGGRPARHRPYPAAAQEFRQTKSNAVSQRRRHALRQRHLRGQPRPRAQDCRR